MRVPKAPVLAALTLGVAGGSYGIAAAATGTTATATRGSSAPAAPSGEHPWGGQRSDETALTGDALAKVKAIAASKVPGGTIVRVETDADGNATYEAHMTTADGTPVTVYVDAGFAYVSTESR